MTYTTTTCTFSVLFLSLNHIHSHFLHASTKLSLARLLQVATQVATLLESNIEGAIVVVASPNSVFLFM